MESIVINGPPNSDGGASSAFIVTIRDNGSSLIDVDSEILGSSPHRDDHWREPRGLKMNASDYQEFAYYTRGSQLGGQIMIVLLIILLAVVGNVVMIGAVLKMPYLRTVTNLFTINLAISDIGVAILILPVWIISMATGDHSDDAPFPYHLCSATAFATVLLLLVSIATLAGISIDRYLCICHPLRYPVEVTSRRVYAALAYIWIQSTLLAMAPLLGWGHYKYRPQTIPICNPEWTENISFAIFLVLLGLVFPFLLMVLSYIRIIQEARKQAHRIEQIQLQLVRKEYEQHTDSSGNTLQINGDASGPQRRPSMLEKVRKGFESYQKSSNAGKAYSAITRNLKTLKTVFIMVGAFFLCWGPYVLLNLWSINSVPQRVPYMADLLTTLLAFSNSAVNPFVFIWLTRDFRYAVRLMLARCLICVGGPDAAIRRLHGGPQGRRASRQGDSVVESVRIGSRASFDSGVELDNKDSPCRRLSGGCRVEAEAGIGVGAGARAGVETAGASNQSGPHLLLPNSNPSTNHFPAADGGASFPGAGGGAGRETVGWANFESPSSPEDFSAPIPKQIVIIPHGISGKIPTIVVPGQVDD